MAQANVIGTVGNINGQVFARGADGVSRLLKRGDVVREGESIVANNGAEAQLKLTDGRELTVRPGDTVKLDTEVTAEIKPDGTDSAVGTRDHFDAETVGWHWPLRDQQP